MMPQPSIALSLALLLAACNAPAPSDEPGTESADPPTTAATASDRMPDALLGTYDADAQACAELTTMTRLVVSRDTLDFYYGYATVDAVDARGGGYDVGATLYQLEGAVEVVPEPTTYRIDPDGDGLRLDGPGEAPPRALVRCAAASVGDGTAGGVRSEYSEIAGCETIETFEESGGSVQRCAGVRGVPLFVSEGDLRYDVDAGVRNDAFETPSGFNALGETVEWRLRDGRPFAVIVRYEVEGPSGTAADRRSDLAVIRVGRDGAPGCLVGYVPADAAPDQNTAARALADREAAAFACDA